jgi:hypothetical protein
MSFHLTGTDITNKLELLDPYSLICIVTFHFVGFSRADDAEPATETVDADIGSSREGSRTGKAFISFI